MKEKFDRNDNAGEEKLGFWMNSFRALKIDATLLISDNREENRVILSVIKIFKGLKV